MPPSRFDTGLAQRLRRWSAKWGPQISTASGWAERAGALARKTWPAAHRASLPGQGPEATKADVLACYHLLLGREPDPGGMAHYQDRLRLGLTRPDLVGEFLGSVEFNRRHGAALRRPSYPQEIVTTAEGFRLCVDPSDFAVGHTIARTGVYEPEVTKTVRGLLARGRTFVDVGANLGWFSILAATLVGPEGTVVAVEPNPRNLAYLRRSAEENGLSNIVVLNIAAGAESGVAALETDGSNGRLVPLGPPPAEAQRVDFIVPAQPLDHALKSAGVGPVDVMKIDVEGAEPLVLEGAAATIAASLPVLVTEFYPLALDASPWGSAAGYLATLRELGYRLSVIGGTHTQPGGQEDREILAMAGPDGHVDLLATPA